MSIIKKHQCHSCGGELTAGNGKQMYYCASCGSTYDYEYFGEEQMRETGETHLSRGEFLAAVDAFNFILEKNPQDFLALRGLLLASAHLTDMDELVREDKRKIQAKITLHNEERQYYYVMDRHGQMKDPKVTFFPLVICGVIMLASGLPFFIIQADLGSNSVAQAVGWFSVIIGTIMTGCSFIFIFPKERDKRNR